MVQALSYTPQWLVRPAPGSRVFQSSQAATIGTAEAPVPVGHRGTEIFVAVQNEIRWANLSQLQDLFETEKNAYKQPGFSQAAPPSYPYRTLKVPVSRPIKSLTVSPNGDLLVILTEHTAHVAVLPDSAHLGHQTDAAPTRLKSFQLGPTDHVLDRAPIASAIWHPLGVNGNCLVTITTDAVVRLWELDVSNRHSFDKAATAIDLKKLGNASLSAEDMSPSKYGSRQFSPDDFELEVASACFGGRGEDAETPWSGLTLWLAMRNGDLYCMCPLLPRKWNPSPALVESLLATIALKFDDRELKDAQTLNKQLQWATELDEQARIRPEDDAPLNRPSRTPSVPMLQGPLRLVPDADDIFETSDILVIPGKNKTGGGDLEFADDDWDDEPASPFNIILIGTSEGYVHVLLDVEGIEARWLPSKGPKIFSPLKRVQHVPELILAESIPLIKPSKSSKVQADAQISFTPNIMTRHAVFASHIGGVSSIDLSHWIVRLGDELHDTNAGLDFRLGLLVESARTKAQEIIHRAVPKPVKLKQHDFYEPADADPEDADGPEKVVERCINLFSESNGLGHFLLTTINGLPHAVVLEDPSIISDQASDDSFYQPEDTGSEPLKLEYEEVDSRQPYAVSSAFSESSNLPNIPNEPRHARIRRTLTQKNQPISSATLDLLIDVHRSLSSETATLNAAAAELFRRCNLLRAELQDQLEKGVDLSTRIESVIDEDADEYPRAITAAPAPGDTSPLADVGINAAVERRLEAVRTRHAELAQRYHALKQKQSRIAGRPLSERERAWARSVRELERAVLGPAAREETADDRSAPAHRFRELRAQHEGLVGRAQEHVRRREAAADDAEEGGVGGLELAVGPERRARRQGQVEMLLERETAMVEATAEKVRALTEWGVPL